MSCCSLGNAASYLLWCRSREISPADWTRGVSLVGTLIWQHFFVEESESQGELNLWGKGIAFGFRNEESRRSIELGIAYQEQRETITRDANGVGRAAEAEAGTFFEMQPGVIVVASFEFAKTKHGPGGAILRFGGEIRLQVWHCIDVASLRRRVAWLVARIRRDRASWSRAR